MGSIKGVKRDGKEGYGLGKEVGCVERRVRWLGLLKVHEKLKWRVVKEFLVEKFKFVKEKSLMNEY